MSDSIIPYVEKLRIVDKQLRVLMLGTAMNYAQRDILTYVDEQIQRRRRVRAIVLKARQIGISTSIEGIMFTLAFLMKRMRGLVISHEADSAEHLLGMTQTYWDTWFMKDLFTPRHLSTYRLGWIEPASQIRIATAKNVTAGRSRTIQCLHGSEVAFWDDAKTLMSGLAQSIPQGFPSFVFLESTANGIGGYFYDQWNAAVAGETDYRPFFFPWHQHPEYTFSYLNRTDPTVELESLTNLDDEERILQRIINQTPEDIDDRLRWRRWAIRNLCDNDVEMFHQEYPTTPEEAFISTGRNVFPEDQLNNVYRPMDGVRGYMVSEGDKVRFQASSRGPLVIYRWPGKDMDQSKYMIAGDATRSIRGDFSCAQVLNRRTWEQVAVWRARIDPVSFGDQMALLGRYYNWAVLCPEIQGAGDATISRLISLQYPFLFEHRRAEKLPGVPEKVYGWWATTRSKAEAIGNLLKVIVDRDIIIHDINTYNEARAFQALDGGRFGNGDDEKNDDTVSALAICITCVMYEMHTINASIGQLAGVGAGEMATMMNEQKDVPWANWQQ